MRELDHGLWLSSQKRAANNWQTCVEVGCADCNFSHRIPVSNGLNPEAMVKRFVQHEWEHVSDKRWVCPNCAKKRASKRKGENAMTYLDKAKAALEKHHAATPVPPTPLQQRKIMAALEDHFDDVAGRYRGDWSDRKIGQEIGIAAIAVADIRRSAFGELKGDPEILALKDEAEKILTALSAFSERIAALEAKKTGNGKA